MRSLLLILLCVTAQAAPLSGRDLLSDKPLVVQPGAKGTVVVFLSTKCPCSNSHVALVKQLAKDFPAFAFVAVHSNRDETVAEARAYFRDFGLPVLQDEKSRLADEFKASKTPHAYVLAAGDGKVLYHGGVTNSQNGAAADQQLLRAALEDVSEGRPVRTPEARTLGCVIAR